MIVEGWNVRAMCECYIMLYWRLNINVHKSVERVMSSNDMKFLTMKIKKKRHNSNTFLHMKEKVTVILSHQPLKFRTNKSILNQSSNVYNKFKLY